MASHKPISHVAAMSAAVDPTGILNRALIERVGVEAVKAALKSVQEALENRALQIAEQNYAVKARQADKNAPDAMAPTAPRLKK